MINAGNLQKPKDHPDIAPACFQASPIYHPDNGQSYIDKAPFARDPATPLDCNLVLRWSLVEGAGNTALNSVKWVNFTRVANSVSDGNIDRNSPIFPRPKKLVTEWPEDYRLGLCLSI